MWIGVGVGDEVGGKPPGGPSGGLRKASGRVKNCKIDPSKSADSRAGGRGTKSPVVSGRVGPGRDGNEKLLQTLFPTRPGKKYAVRGYPTPHSDELNLAPK